MDLDVAFVNALEARTEGWIAGLQLAALSMQGKSTERISDFIQHFSGSHRHVIDYLADEVLAQQSEGQRSFLCQTSILGRLSASLCDAVTGRSDSREVLRELDQANLFLVPLDDRREWYRYHRLFADFLRTELDAETQASLHKEAARWLEAHDLVSEAVHHALAAGDVDRAARLVASTSAEALAMGSLVTLQGWLDALPDDVVRGQPTWPLLKASCCSSAGTPRRLPNTPRRGPQLASGCISIYARAAADAESAPGALRRRSRRDRSILQASVGLPR